MGPAPPNPDKACCLAPARTPLAADADAFFFFPAPAAPDESDLDFFFGGGGTSQAQSGMNESTNPTSSNRFGKIQMPGFATTTVINQKINLIIAITKKNPINPNAATDKYQTPNLIVGGHKGNITPANITPTIPNPANFKPS